MPTSVKIPPSKLLSVLNQNISFFAAIVQEKSGVIEPLAFWVLTDNHRGHRFYIDAWTLHWDVYKKEEYEPLLDKDLEEYEDYKVLDLMEEYALKGQQITSLGFFYQQVEELGLCASLRLKFSNGLQLQLDDYETAYKSEFKITKG